jgi:hypothetical protein
VVGIELPVFPTELTADEEAFGFEIRESPTGVRAAVRPLDGGLQIVKRRRDDGSIEYTICDSHCTPIYRSSESIAELKNRFP